MSQDVLDEYLNSIRDRENLNTEQPPAETSSSFSNYITSLETTEERPQGPSYSDPLVLDYVDKLQKAPRSFLQGRTYTLDQLEKDPEFQVRADRFMESIDADEDIFEYLRDTDFSLSSAIVRSGQVKGWSEEAKEDYNYLRDKFDNAEIGSTQQFLRLAGDMTVDLIADPINWLAALFFIPSGGQSATATAAGTIAAKEVVKKGLSKIAKKGLKESTKEGLEYTKKTAILGAVEGGAWTGAHDYFLQNTDIELGLRDEVDWSQVGITTGLGVGLGGVFGGSIGALTSITPALSKKIFKYSNEGDIIKSDQTVSKQLELEGFGDDKAVDEVVIKDSTKVDKRPITDKDKKQKRLRKRKQIIANTFGKVTTQFVEMAENSPQMQKLLGRFRYDWARTFTTGVRGVEAESYGLSLSERTQGYLFDMRKALNPLLRDKGWFKNTLRKDQNDNLVYLLRLEKKEFENLVESGKANIAGREVVTAAKEIRKLLNEMFEEGVETGLMTRNQFVDHFFPRHFQHSKILADKPKFTKIIADSEHSIPQNIYAESAIVKGVTAAGKEEQVIPQSQQWIDKEVFNRNFVDEASNGRTSDWKLLTPAEQLEARSLKAEKIVEDMLDMKYSPFQFGTKNNAGAGHSFLQHRVFNKIDDTDLVDFLENNVEDVLEQYITDASRAITRTKFFGKSLADYEKTWLIPISKELRKEGVESDQIAETLRRLRLMHSRVTGLDTDKIRIKNKFGAYGLDALKLSQQMAHLPFATVSSLTEPLILLSRIDSLGGKFDATKQIGKALVKGVKKDIDKFTHYVKRVSGKEVRGFADMSDEYWHEAYKVGLAMEQAVMHRIESLTGEALTSPLAKRFQNAFFKANLLSQWTGAVQLASFTTGKRLIRENTEQLINGKTLLGRKLSDSKRKYLTKQLNELGIDEKEAKQWYKQSLDPKTGIFDEGRAMGTASSLRKYEQKKQIFFYKNRYQSGANRFTREIILNPSTAEANRPLWFSHPAGQLLAQFAGYPTVFNNTILKRWINEGLIENKRQTSAKIAGTALAMTAIATFTNAVRSQGRSLEEEDGTIILEAIQRWGGLGPGDYAYRFYENANTGSGQAGALLKTPSGPIVSDVFDAVLYRKGLAETLTANVPFYSALPKDIRDSMKKSGRSVDKALWGSMFPQTGPQKKVVGRGSPGRDVNYAKGGIVLNVPNASREPDEKKVRGLPLTYAELGGVLAQDVEDRKGFVKGGIVNRISQESVNDEVIRHLTKEIRKAEPIYESTTTTSLYKKAEADEFAKNVDGEAIRYVNSDRLNDLEEELRYSTELGVKVTTKAKASGGKKIKYKGRLRLVRPLELGDVSPKDLTGSNFIEAIQTDSALRNNIINNSPLPEEDATKLVKKLVDEYKDTQKLVRGYSEQPIEVTQPLLDIKQSIKARETLTDLGYDSIRYNDSEYILFDNNQFRVNKKLRLRKMVGGLVRPWQLAMKQTFKKIERIGNKFDNKFDESLKKKDFKLNKDKEFQEWLKTLSDEEVFYLQHYVTNEEPLKYLPLDDPFYQELLSKSTPKEWKKGFAEGGEVEKEEEEKDSFTLVGKDGWLFDPTNPLDYAMLIPGVGLVGWGAKLVSSAAKASKVKSATTKGIHSTGGIPKTVYHGGEEFDKMKFGKTDKPVLTEGIHRSDIEDEIGAVYTSASPSYAREFMQRYEMLKGKKQIEKVGNPGFMKIDISDLKPKEIHFWDKPTKKMSRKIDEAIEYEKIRRKTEVGIDPVASNVRIGELHKLKTTFPTQYEYFPYVSLFQRTFLRENNIRMMTKSTNANYLNIAKKEGKFDKFPVQKLTTEYILLDKFPVQKLSKSEMEESIKAYRKLIKTFFE